MLLTSWSQKRIHPTGSSPYFNWSTSQNGTHYSTQITRTYHLLLRRARAAFARRPLTCLLAGALLLGLLYLLLSLVLLSSSLSSPEGAQHRAYDSGLAGLSAASRCGPMSANTAAAYASFLRALLGTLDKLVVRHFLCYESLAKALRHAQLEEGAEPKARKKSTLRLADGCLNLCVLNEELMAHEEALVERRFRNAGITLKYQHGDGLYLLTPSTAIFRDAFGDQTGDGDGLLHPELFTLHARVHVFEVDPRTDEYRRVGWKRRLLPPTMCNQLHCFPPGLVEAPLPVLKLPGVGVAVSVPREGLEMLKYQFPESWWKMNDADDCGD